MYLALVYLSKVALEPLHRVNSVVTEHQQVVAGKAPLLDVKEVLLSLGDGKTTGTGHNTKVKKGKLYPKFLVTRKLYFSKPASHPGSALSLDPFASSTTKHKDFFL